MFTVLGLGKKGGHGVYSWGLLMGSLLIRDNGEPPADTRQCKPGGYAPQQSISPTT